MRKTLAYLILWVLGFTFTFTGSAFADGSFFGPKFRFEPRQVGDYVELNEPEGNHQFTELCQLIDDLEDQLGYRPRFDIFYSDQVVTIYLYQTMLEIPCLVDKLSNRVLVPDVWPSEQVMSANELYSSFEAEEYELYDLENEDFKILKAGSVRENRPLRITIQTGINGEDGKTFEVETWDYEAYPEKSTFKVGNHGFIQLWYEVHGCF